MLAFSIYEIRDLILMSLILGVIFKDFIPIHLLISSKKKVKIDSQFIKDRASGIFHYKKKSFFDRIRHYFDSDYWFSILIIAPAIVLHELSHKIVAQYFGLNATFYAAYKFLAFALVMKMIFPLFVFFVPGYVATYCTSTSQYCVYSEAYQTFIPSSTASAAISFGGPFANLLLFFLAWFLIKKYYSDHNNVVQKKDRAVLLALVIMKRLNFFLFILNMLPIPGFDGFHFFSALWRIFG